MSFFNKMQEWGEQRGIKFNLVPSSSPWVTPLLRFRFESSQALDEFIEYVAQQNEGFQLGTTEWIIANSQLYTGLPEYLAVDLLDVFADTTESDYASEDTGWSIRHWCWQSERFEVNAKVPTLNQVSIRKSMQDKFHTVFSIDYDGDVRETHNENWALFWAYNLAGKNPAKLTADELYIDCPNAAVFLPLPFGRFCSVVGDGLPGPQTGQTRKYPRDMFTPLVHGCWIIQHFATHLVISLRHNRTRLMKRNPNERPDWRFYFDTGYVH